MLNFLPPTANYPIPGTMQTLFTNPGMVLSSVLVLSLLVCYVTLTTAVQRRFCPTLSQLVQEIVAGADSGPVDAALASLAAGKTGPGQVSGRLSSEPPSGYTPSDSDPNSESKSLVYS